MFVKAAPGTTCPKEDNPRTYIDDSEAGTEVPNTAYYIRLVADGSLSVVAPAAPAKKKEVKADGQ